MLTLAAAPATCHTPPPTSAFIPTRDTSFRILDISLWMDFIVHLLFISSKLKQKSFVLDDKKLDLM